MTFEKISPTSFAITTETTDGKITKTYAVPPQIGLWQAGELGKIVKLAFTEIGDLGSLLMNAFFSFMSGGEEKAALEKELEDVEDNDRYLEIQAKIKAIDGSIESFLKDAKRTGLINKLGDIAGFLSENNLLPKVAAILFLQRGPNGEIIERKLSDDALAARMDLFQELPLSFVTGGLWDFFGSKQSSKSNSLSPLQTSANPENPIPLPSALN